MLKELLMLGITSFCKIIYHDHDPLKIGVVLSSEQTTEYFNKGSEQDKEKWRKHLCSGEINKPELGKNTFTFKFNE